MLGVAGLVEEGMPVVRAADRLDDEQNPVGDLDRRAEGAWGLRGACLEIELDVLLLAEVDPEPAEGRLERRDHAVGRKPRVPVGGAEETRHVPAFSLLEGQADPASKQAVE